MALAFSANGFDDSRKARAEDCEAKMDLATAAMGAFGLGATALFPPLAPGFIFAAALGPILKYSFTRIRLDPAREDFFRAAAVQPPSLATAALIPVERPDEFAPELIAALLAYPLTAERAAAHQDAMVTAVERAAGAYAAQAHSAMELRVAEAKYHAWHARNAAAAALAASSPLVSFGLEYFDDLEELVSQFDEDLTFEQHLADVSAANLLLSSGINARLLTRQPLYRPGINWSEVTPHVITEAAEHSYELMESISGDLPPSVHEFIAETEDTSAETPVRA